MELIWHEMTAGFPDTESFIRIVVRLVVALLLGAIVGYQREKAGKAAGLRTHMLVAMATTLFVLAGVSAELSAEGISRVIQGVATGIGFIGTGAIIKLSEKREIHGLTTAASVWMTSALGVAVGLGRIGIAILCVALTWIVLSLVGQFERRLGLSGNGMKGENSSGANG